MRRSEFSIHDQGELNRIGDTCEIGYLGINDPEGFPRVIPLNFLLMEESLYFHGAGEGEKFDLFRFRPKVTFSVVEPYSHIPSSWTAKDYACNATTFFKSIYFRGEGSLVDDLNEKAIVLQAFMEKYQPEGNYRPISAKDPLYKKALKEVIVFKIVPNHVDIKFKFGQNMSVKQRQVIIRKLEERNEGPDALTVEEIRKTLETG